MTAIAALSRRLADRPGPGAPLGAALAAFTLMATLAMLSHGGLFPSRPGEFRLEPVAVVLAAGSTMPLVLWRRYRFGAFVVCAAFGTALAATGQPADLLLGSAVALYLLAANRERPWTKGTTAVIVGLFAAYLVAGAAAQGEFPGSELLHTGLAWAAAWFAGERTRLSREHIEDLRQRAARAERESERERLLAVAEERARIARDLHDSAGHAISLIAVRAGAARLRDEPEASRRALEAVEGLARQTAAEIDQLVSTLREDHGVEAPAGLDSLDTLIAHHGETGLDVALEISGEARPLSAVADQAAYRILQEALTNAARHGTGTARVDLVYGEGAVEFTVANPIGAENHARPEGGHGLIGMRERANLLGGELDTAAADGRFRVRAIIPYGGRRP